MIEKWKNKYLKKYKLKSVGNISYLVQIGELHDAKKVLKLNDTGAFIWRTLESCRDLDDAIQIFCKTYSIPVGDAYDEIIECIDFCNNNM